MSTCVSILYHNSWEKFYHTVLPSAFAECLLGKFKIFLFSTLTYHVWSSVFAFITRRLYLSKLTKQVTRINERKRKEYYNFVDKTKKGEKSTLVIGAERKCCQILNSCCKSIWESGRHRNRNCNNFQWMYASLLLFFFNK